MKSNILLIICLLSMKYSEEAIPFSVCGAVGHIGVANVAFYGTQAWVQVSGNNTDTAYFINDPDTVFPCCGVIEEWDAYVKEAGTITFDIWRSTDGKNLKLVGSNQLSQVAQPGEVVYNVPSGAQYTVLPGDYVGWYTPLKEMMACTLIITGEATDVEFFKLRPSSLSVGLSLDWSMAESQPSYTCLIRARFGVNEPPIFLNLDEYINVYPPIPIGTVIYIINATDPDISDTTITQLTYRMISGNWIFAFNPTTRQVSVAADLTPYVGYQCIIFEVEDICTNKDTGSLCIFIYNEPPTITYNPVTATVIETTAGNIALTTVDVSDPTDDVTCSLSRTQPPNSPFYLRQELFEYKIYVSPNPGFRQATRDTYSVYVTCTDTKNYTTVRCDINILPSSPPQFTNLPGLVLLSTANVNTDPVYAVSVTDPDSTSFIFSMTCSIIPCPFAIYNSGNIQLNKNLNFESVSGYDLYITVTDGYSTVTDTLSVNISGINIPPKFTNLPLATDLYVEENKPLGSSVYDVRAIDNDGDSLMYSMMSIPGTGLIYFSIDSASGLISTSTLNAINYEAMRDKVFALKISVTDGKLTESQTLVIRISNVNEGLSFSQNTYRIVASGRMAGTQLPNPGFVVIDDDGRDTRTFRHDCGADTGYLTMNTENGILAFAVDYDREVPGNPTRITCVVTATDSGGLTATTTLSITLKGNAPPKFTNLPLTSDLYVPENTVIGSSVYKVSATDSDKDALTYSMMSYPGAGGFYFSINSTSGIISTSAVNTINYETISDKDFAFTVSVTDGKLTESQNLTIRIFDVNEGPSFAQNMYRIVANEGLAGTQLPDPGFIINDVDIGDTVTFLYNCGPNTGYFTMNSVNARLTFAVEYDLDVPGQPTLITCTITGIDSGGLTATATLSLSMRDVNDNTPTFQHYLYTFDAHSDSTVGTVLGSISATDADSGQNGQIVYSTDQTGLTQTYFDVSSTGQVILKRNLNGIAVGTILLFTAHATNVGSPSRTGSTSVKIIVIG